MSLVSWAPALLVGAGVAWSGQALVDPVRPSGALGGPLLAAAALLVAARRGGAGAARLVFPSLLAVAFALGARAGMDFRADSASYYVYLRSAFFDHDLDFSNERAQWEVKQRRLTLTGLRRNAQSVGPAVLWSPFYAAVHAYVLADRAFLGGRYAPDGYSPPYRRATALGTITWALLGAWALLRALERRSERGVALLAVGAVIVASSILYYLFVLPAMAHGIAFGLAAALLWALDRARHAPSLGSWTLVGAVFGLLVMTRWQAAVFALLIAPLALEALRRRRARIAWLGAAAAAAALAFLPQMVAWKLLYGSLLTIPQGQGFMDWSSPHFLDTLISADHGLFTWTPVALLGFLGLALALRRDPPLHAGAWLVLLATAWVNGAVPTWNGGDAFGARRFDVVVPLAALGLPAVIEALAAWARRRPFLVPAAGLALLGLWNVLFIGAFREGRYEEAAPLDRLAGDSGRHFRLLAQDVLGWLAGEEGRALAYRMLDGEYLDLEGRSGATIHMASVGERELSGAWSPPRRKPGEPPFRWALKPASCVRVPLRQAADLRVWVTARAQQDAQPQHVTLVVNGTAAGTAAVGTEWRDVLVSLPARAVRPGENWLCLEFSSALPSENEGVKLTAQVARVRLEAW